LLRCLLAFLSRLVVLLGCPDGVRLGFLAMFGGLATKSLALEPSVLRRPSGGEHHQRNHDQNGDDYGNHCNR
jgi:hypothetical protein